MIHNSILKQGVTLIEILIVISIIGIIGASASPFLSSFILKNNLETTVDKTISTLRKAQAYAMDGKQGALWGACKTGKKLRLFTVSCETPGFAEDFSIPGSVAVSSFSTTYSLRGEPSSGEFTITINSGIDSKTVTVNSVGGMTIN